eukprot:1161226-Pelagomonas_calceolata.AAC.18
MPLLGPGSGGARSRTSQSTCGPFQLAAEPTDLHNSNYDGIFKSCSINGVSCCMNRALQAATMPSVSQSISQSVSQLVSQSFSATAKLKFSKPLLPLSCLTCRKTGSHAKHPCTKAAVAARGAPGSTITPLLPAAGPASAVAPLLCGWGASIAHNLLQAASIAACTSSMRAWRTGLGWAATTCGRRMGSICMNYQLGHYLGH